MKMMLNLVRFGRRQLHTIVSRELIKPSSTTPSHLKTHNLTFIDQAMVNIFMPIVTFYPNTSIHHSSHEKTLELKNSLSQTLTKYYPFAGRHDKIAPTYIDCNDNGAEFYEASIDSTLSDFLQNSQHEDLNQFFPRLNYSTNINGDHHLESDKVIPLMVQVSHFECGGVAVAVSMSHKIADGTSLVHFTEDWAKMTRFRSPRKEPDEFCINPQFISFEYTNINSMGLSIEISNDCVSKTFLFPNSKINELKVKVKAMTVESEQPIMNPTRVEVLNWLLYKCAVAAATKNNSGFFKPTGVCHLADIRGKMMEPLPEKSIGNFVMVMEIATKNESEIKPESFISDFKKQKMQLQGLRNFETFISLLSGANLEELQAKFESGYTFSSLCGYPAYEIDFGWGKPVKVTMPGFTWKNCVIMMDAPNGDGVEALVCLGKQDMDIFESDPELLAFT